MSSRWETRISARSPYGRDERRSAVAHTREPVTTRSLEGFASPPAQLLRPDYTTARLALTPPSLDFGKVPIGVPMQLGASVQNTGQAQLNR